MEQREYTRVQVNLPARLTLGSGLRLFGTVQDLSFAGAHFDCQDPPSEAETGPGAALEIDLPVGPGSAAARIDCWLVYVEGGRLGLRFTGSEEDDYRRLRTYLLAHAPDPQRLREEIAYFPNPAFPYSPDFPTLPEWLERLLGRRRGAGRHASGRL
jgi:hypothetical protein